MPELPEVETICRKITPKLLNNTLLKISCRRQDLRIPIPKDLSAIFVQKKIKNIYRRSKYLMLDFGKHTLILHLGMSGRLFFTDVKRVLDKHDHVLFDFENGMHLRFRDPRRFGLMTYAENSKILQHPLFLNLGPEPLEDAFNQAYLQRMCQHKTAIIKNVIMDAKVVVGVGNIYASEALLLAGIRPQRQADSLTKIQSAKLCAAIKKILQQSIDAGGTSFKDYVNPFEEPGLHQLKLAVYGRGGAPCRKCSSLVERQVLGNRSLYYCPQCQK